MSKSSHGLYQHKAKQHPWLRAIQQENAKYKCNICGKASKTSKGLSNHKWKYHRPNTATKTVPYIPNGTNLATLSNTTALAVKYESNGSSTVNVKFETSAGNLEVKYEPQDTANSLMSGDESSEAGDERHQHHHRQLSGHYWVIIVYLVTRIYRDRHSLMPFLKHWPQEEGIVTDVWGQQRSQACGEL